MHNLAISRKEICKLKNQFVIFLITIFVARLIRRFTGISYYNPFTDKFDLGLFIKDFMVWIISYAAVSLVVSRFY